MAVQIEHLFMRTKNFLIKSSNGLQSSLNDVLVLNVKSPRKVAKYKPGLKTSVALFWFYIGLKPLAFNKVVGRINYGERHYPGIENGW